MPSCTAIFGEGAALCRSIDSYCERTSAAFDAEPLNALTAAVMLVSAVAAARLQSTRPNREAAGPIWGAIAAIALGGIGATLFHTAATVWAVIADTMPFLVFMLITLWLTLTRFFGWSAPAAVLALTAFLAAALGGNAVLPAGLLPGGAYYFVPLIVLGVVAVAMKRRGLPGAGAYLAASAVFLAAIVARQADLPLCAAVPFGTHFLWHLFAALLAYILIRAAILHAPPRRLQSR